MSIVSFLKKKKKKLVVNIYEEQTKSNIKNCFIIFSSSVKFLKKYDLDDRKNRGKCDGNFHQIFCYILSDKISAIL